MSKLQRQILSEVFSDYRKYKPYLRQDFHYHCVYCTVHEVEWGGLRNFHVDHYRPKSRFPHLICDYSNLLYACGVCNVYKGDDWPSDDPLEDGQGYLDPCEHDFDDHFRFQDDGIICGLSPVAKYMIERLHLNRSQIVRQRYKRYKDQTDYELHLANYDAAIALAQQAIASCCDTEDETRKELVATFQRLNQAKKELLSKWESRWDPPYDVDDLR